MTHGDLATDYYDRPLLEQSEDERDFDLTLTRLLNGLAAATTAAARLLPHGGSGASRPWTRDEAVLGGMAVRCSKLLRAYAQSFEQRRLEICNFLGRGVIETTIDLRYLLRFGTAETFQKFVAYAFVGDLQLRAQIEENVEARNGVVLPIDDRLLVGIKRRMEEAEITADDVPRSPRESWAGSVRDRLRKLGLEEMYQGAFALPSGYVHGSWHELAAYHLDRGAGGEGYVPDTAFSDVRPQPAGAITLVTTDAISEWLFMRLPETDERDDLLARLTAMHDAVVEIEQLHENYIGRTGGPELH